MDASDAEDSSRTSSDSESAQRVHPTASDAPNAAEVAVMPALHGFSCGFAQRRCGHDELFHPHYTRTNLRKGDKILRCFPHCCPDHVTRSFCGASLHLDVQWDSPGASSSSSTAEGAAPDVLVFARFRVRDTRGLSAGDHVTLHEISQSLQSESNPHGEWISARAVSTTTNSQQHLSWVFEVNHEARWYYHWESGVAKRHRLKHHVLDVFVLSPSFSSTGPWNGGHGELDARRPLQVVASTHSPPFRLISFRRATPKAVQALSVPRVSTDARPVKVGTKKSIPAAKSATNPKPSASPSASASASASAVSSSSSSTAATLAAMKRGRPTADDLDLQRHRVAPPPPPAFSSREPSGSGRVSFANLTASLDYRSQHRQPPASLNRLPPALLSDQSPLTALRLQQLFSCLPLVRTADALQYMDTFQRVYADALARATGFRSATLPTVSPVDAVHQLLADLGSVPHSGRQAPLPHELTAIVCELLLWLAFDVDLHRAVSTTFAQEAASIFAQPQLLATYTTFLEWLARHVDAFLRDRGWRLEAVVHGAAEWLGQSANSLNIAPHEAFANGQRMLVAQLSEQYVRQSKASKPLRRRLSHAIPRLLGSSTRPHASWAINGDWYCAMLQGGFRAGAASARPVHASADHGESLISLFALVRELGAVSVRLNDDQLKPTLNVASLLHDSGESASSTLRLDQNSQWFSCFPSGVSTAALQLGGLCWGDHVGNASPATQEVHVNLYAWSSSSSSSSSARSLAIGRCFQVRLTTPSPHSLVVSVAVTTALMDEQLAAHRGLTTREAVLEELPFWSLQQKLQIVRAFEPSHSAELHYTRVG